MLLDSLKIQAFRGIKNDLPLELRARLTLIHAPNGVGKTSLCDAVEWLFTGEVERLKEPLGKTKGKGVTNIFTSAQPLVEATINNGRSARIRRANTSKLNEIEILENGKWKKTPLNTLLTEITPGNLPQSSKGLQQLNNRRSWFRAVRLLEAHALDLLLDTDDPSNDVRDLVFCDLLGVGELQRRERNLRKIVAAIGGKVQLRKDTQEIRRQISERQSEINAEAMQAKAPSLQVFQQQLTAAWTRLGEEQLIKAGPPESNIVAADNLLTSANRRLLLQQAASKHVMTNANRYLSLGEEILRFENERNALTNRRKQIENQIATAQTSLQRLENEISTAERLEHALLSQPFDSVKSRLERTLAEWKQYVLDERRLDLSALESSLVAARAKQAESNRFLGNVITCEQSLKLWREAKTRERAISQTIVDIKLPTSDDRKKVGESLLTTRSRLAATESEFDQLAGPLEQLRIAGRQFLKGATEEQRCPLCAHDHGAPTELHKAIATGVSNMPGTLNKLGQQRQELELEISRSEQQLKLWNETSETLEVLIAEREEVRSTLLASEPLLGALGFETNDLLDEAFSGRLVELRARAEEDATRAKRVLETNSSIFDAGLQLNSIAQEIATLAANIKAITKLDVDPNLESLSPNDWLGVLEGVTLTAEKRSADARSLAATTTQNANNTRAGLATLQSDRDALITSISHLNEQANHARADRGTFEAQWRTISDKPWTPELLAAQQAAIEKDVENLAQAKAEIDSARLALSAARDVESKERERVRGQRQLVQLNTRLRQLEAIESMRDECVMGADTLKAAKDTFIKEQIQPLCDVITALYVRAQSTTFIDRIDSSQDEGPLRWLARIGERQLEDTAQMSLGQRQDLALAIFLSRARELGGTFFLDEPLQNLDDLNRLAVLDVLRTIVVEERSRPVRLVVTTANHSLVRHCREKFALINGTDDQPAFAAYRLIGDPQSGVTAVVEH
jgi:DNA repair exonuclease SbcCD ATPase subunit